MPRQHQVSRELYLEPARCRGAIACAFCLPSHETLYQDLGTRLAPGVECANLFALCLQLGQSKSKPVVASSVPPMNHPPRIAPNGRGPVRPSNPSNPSYKARLSAPSVSTSRSASGNRRPEAPRFGRSARPNGPSCYSPGRRPGSGRRLGKRPERPRFNPPILQSSNPDHPSGRPNGPSCYSPGRRPGSGR